MARKAVAGGWLADRVFLVSLKRVLGGGRTGAGSTCCGFAVCGGYGRRLGGGAGDHCVPVTGFVLTGGRFWVTGFIPAKSEDARNFDSAVRACKTIWSSDAGVGMKCVM
jgi:uncharacterized protein YcfJ